MIKFLLEKEFKLIKRNSFMPRLIIMMPILMMVLLPYAANMEVKNIRLTVVDSDHSNLSSKFIQKLISSKYFRLVDITTSYDDAFESIEIGESDIIIEIPQNFTRDISRGQTQVLVAANTIDATKGAMGSSYISAIATDFALTELAGKGVEIKPKMTVVTQNRFNPTLNYQYFMLPALMVMLLAAMCGSMPSLNIVGEKESGTIEQMNVTPVHKYVFIISKLIPYWIIGFIALSLCFAIAWLMYGLVPVGNIFTMYLGASLFILTMSGLGLAVSNHSNTMQQSMFVIFFFLLILILLSGLFTPIQSMPIWAQYITAINPLTYFIQIMRGVYLKGSTVMDILPQLGALGIFTIVLNAYAVISYHKNS